MCVNPLMPKGYFCTSIKYIVFKLQAANTDLFNPIVPKVHSSVKSTFSFTK